MVGVCSVEACYCYCAQDSPSSLSRSMLGYLHSNVHLLPCLRGRRQRATKGSLPQDGLLRARFRRRGAIRLFALRS